MIQYIHHNRLGDKEKIENYIKALRFQSEKELIESLKLLILKVWQINNVNLPENFSKLLEDKPYDSHTNGLYLIALKIVLEEKNGNSPIRVYNSNENACCIDLNDEVIKKIGRETKNFLLLPMTKQ